MMRTMRWLLLLPLAACVDGGTPSRFLVYDFDSARDAYRMMPRDILTLDDPARGAGTVALLHGGGAMAVVNPNPESRAEWEEAFGFEGIGEPRIQWVLRDNGVAMPLDFDSAMMLTIYHHLERASEYFDSIGVPLATVRRMPVYYGTNLQVNVGFLPVPLLADNAAYVMNVDAFLIPPRNLLDDVPLFANPGVIIHEYSHAVFNRLVHGDTRVPAYLIEDWSTEAQNEMRSLDEGVADFFAASAVEDPSFLAPSIPNAEELDIDRDLSVERHYDESVRWSVTSGGLLDYDPYELGSVIASTLWALRSQIDATVLAEALVRTLDATAATESFALVGVFDGLVDRLPAAAQDAACDLITDRLDAVAGDLTCRL